MKTKTLKKSKPRLGDLPQKKEMGAGKMILIGAGIFVGVVYVLPMVVFLAGAAIVTRKGA